MEEPPLLNKSWAENGPHFAAVEMMRKCLYWLSAQGARVLRMQTKEGRVLVETSGPVDTGVMESSEIYGGEEYGRTEVYGCQVLWRQPTTNDGDLPDGNSDNP